MSEKNPSIENDDDDDNLAPEPLPDEEVDRSADMEPPPDEGDVGTDEEGMQ